jgi:hypothetical protein
MAKDKIVIDHDPDDRGKEKPVTVTIDTPDRATSKGWGDMSWLRR